MGSIPYSRLPEWQSLQITPWLRINPEDILMWLKHLWEYVRQGKTKHCGKKGSTGRTSVGRPQDKDVAIHKRYTLLWRHERTSTSPWPCLNIFRKESVDSIGFHSLGSSGQDPQVFAHVLTLKFSTGVTVHWLPTQDLSPQRVEVCELTVPLGHKGLPHFHVDDITYGL